MRLGKLSKINVMYAAIVAVACFVGPHSAMAEQSSLYAAFTKCPTGASVMNEPANEGAACVAGAVRHGSIKVGSFEAQITSPLRFQFALTGGSSGLQVVPDSTSLEAQPFLFPNPFYVPPGPAQPGKPAGPGKVEVPNPVHKKKKHKKKRHKKIGHKKNGHKKKNGKNRSTRHHRARGPSFGQQPGTPIKAASSSTQTASGAMIEVFVESAGEVRSLDLSAFAGEPGTAFELPLKLHLRGSGLGPVCYIGSDSDPIVVAPSAVGAPPGLQIGQDPNGFKVSVLGMAGASLEDKSFAAPGASGCGLSKGSLDASINSLLGLPSGGSSKALLGDLLLEIAGAEYDGTPPDGGAELRAAFEAAQ